MSDLPTFGRRLAQIRASRGLSQKDLARIVVAQDGSLGVSPQYVSGLETGDDVNPTTRTVHALCAALDCSAADLLDDTAERASAIDALREAVEAETHRARVQARSARREAIAQCAGKIKKRENEA